MKVAIIGAGVAGLCAGRHCKHESFQFDIFEATDRVGGVWNYTDTVGTDKFGFPIHTPMYRGLRTNLPKEVMELEGFSFPELDNSYIGQEVVLKYIQDYAKHFQLEPHIRFLKRVVKIQPNSDKKWTLEIQDMKTEKIDIFKYDAVIVCNGHYSKRSVPKIQGLESFPGNWIHSHDYRGPDDRYKNKRILLLGAGPSGVDISGQLAPIAKKVYLSFSPAKAFMPISKEVIAKPLLKELTGNQAVFDDDSTAEIDEIMFCTGYDYSFPFLSEDCKIKVENNCVQPLYKQVINIEHPTMAIIGMLTMICPFPEMDIQVRFFLASLKGHFSLPSKEEMYGDFRKELQRIGNKPSKLLHAIGLRQGEYFDDLAATSKIKRVAPVVTKLYLYVRMHRNLQSLFKILDEENFVKVR